MTDQAPSRQNFSPQQIAEWSDAHPSIRTELEILSGATRVARYFLDAVPAGIQTIRYAERVISEEDPARKASIIGARLARERALLAAEVEMEYVIGARALIEPAIDNSQLTAIADVAREYPHRVGLIADCEEAEELPGEWPDEVAPSSRRNLIVVGMEEGGDRVLLDDGLTLVEEGRTSQGLVAVARHLSETALRGRDLLAYIGEYYA